MAKKLFCIIINWNGGEKTHTAISALRAYGIASMDIVILDNGSTVNEAAILEQRWQGAIRVIRSEENKGFAAGNNFVVDQLEESYETIAFINQDVRVHEGTLAACVSYLNDHERVAVVGPRVCRANGDVESVGAHLNPWTGKVISENSSNEDPHDVDVIIGNCFVVRRSAWERVGGFDERYFAYYEEVDWCRRARTAGWNVVALPHMKVTHEKTHRFRTYFNVRNMIWFQKKYASLPQLFFFFWYFWFFFFPERIKKGSSLRSFLRAAKDGWLHTS